jgi:aspartyl-tRNA(Asn)/glutamyl-tRNA(Gln) amidotransferase subunit A
MQLNRLTAHELLKDLELSKVTHKDILNSLKTRIDEIEPKVKAYVRLPDFESLSQSPIILRQAQDTSPKDTEQSRSANYQSAILRGIPIAIKDNICVKDEETTCCSRILKGFRPPYDATVIEKLKMAGASILGKTNMDEFAFGSSCETSYYGPTHNPWDLERIPGGSSGGSAAAVAADEAIFALGSDTGGSIRQPAALCGVVGLKPTYGRVSRFGLIAFASSLDQIGPITKDVSDSALIMNIIAGYDSQDSTSVDVEVPDYRKSLINDVKGLKIGVPKEYFVKGIDGEVERAVWKAIHLLKDLGASFEEIRLPHTEYAVATYYIIAPAEASSNLARFGGVEYGLRRSSPMKTFNRLSLIDMYETTRGEGFGPEAKRRVILGTYALSSGYYEAYYLRALKVRTLIKQDFDKAFEKYDCIITSTSPTPAFKIGERVEDPLRMYLSDIFTISANLAGIPAISIPCGFTEGGLPIGLQILTRPFDEEMLFRVAYTYEQNTDWHLRKLKL